MTPLKTLAFITTTLSFSSLALAQTWQPETNRYGFDTPPAGQNSEYTEPGLQTPGQQLDLAEQALFRGNTFLAQKLFAEVSQAQPYNDKARYGLAVAQSQLGDFSTALSTLEPLIAQNSTYAEKATSLKAELLLRLAMIEGLNNNRSQQGAYLQQLQSMSMDESTKQQFGRLYQLYNNSNSGRHTLKVGLLLPLSGPLKPLGEDMLRAAQLALFEHNNANILLYPEDTEGGMQGARTAYDTVLRHGVDLVLGPLTADSVRAVQSMQSRSVPLISFSSDLSVANDNTFLMSFPPEEQARQIARFAAGQGVKRFAILAPQNDFGRILSAVFANEVEKLGGTLVRQATFEASATDLGTPLSQLLRLEESRKRLQQEKAYLQKEYDALAGAMDDTSFKRLQELKRISAEPTIDFEALFIPASAEQMPLIASQLAFYDLDKHKVKLLGPALWNKPQLFSTKGEYLQEGFYTASATNDTAAQAAFNRTYSHQANPLAFLAYDAIHMLNRLYNLGADSAEQVRNMLTIPEGFSGATGGYRFYNNGQIHRLYSVMDINGAKATSALQAPLVLPPQLPQSLEPRDGFFSSFGRSQPEATQPVERPDWVGQEPAQQQPYVPRGSDYPSGSPHAEPQQPKPQPEPEKKSWWFW